MSALDIRCMKNIVMSFFWALVWFGISLKIEAPFGFATLLIGFVYLYLLHKDFRNWEVSKHDQQRLERLK